MSDTTSTPAASSGSGTPSTQTETSSSGSGDYRRWTYGLIAVLGGLVVILLALLIVLDNFDTAADVGSVMGIITTPVATMVGAYFGVAAGSDGKAKADDTAQQANVNAIKAAAMVTDTNKQDALVASIG